jgi:hypothetical protein
LKFAKSVVAGFETFADVLKRCMETKVFIIGDRAKHSDWILSDPHLSKKRFAFSSLLAGRSWVKAYTVRYLRRNKRKGWICELTSIRAPLIPMVERPVRIHDVRSLGMFSDYGCTRSPA